MHRNHHTVLFPCVRAGVLIGAVFVGGVFAYYCYRDAKCRMDQDDEPDQEPSPQPNEEPSPQPIEEPSPRPGAIREEVLGQNAAAEMDDDPNQVEDNMDDLATEINAVDADVSGSYLKYCADSLKPELFGLLALRLINRFPTKYRRAELISKFGDHIDTHIQQWEVLIKEGRRVRVRFSDREIRIVLEGGETRGQPGRHQWQRLL